MEELFEQIDREFKKVGKSRKLPGGVVLVGGMANMSGLANYAKERLQLSAKVGKPSNVGGLADTIAGPEYATSIGLMMLDMILEGHSINQMLPSGNTVTSGLFKKIKNILN